MGLEVIISWEFIHIQTKYQETLSAYKKIPKYLDGRMVIKQICYPSGTGALFSNQDKAVSNLEEIIILCCF